MKKEVPFDLFEKGQTIYFDIQRLSQLENILGDSIITVARNGNAGVNFCLAGLQVGLQHEYKKATRVFYGDKIAEYLEEGGTLDEVATPISRALLASGIFGKQDKEIKNVKKTVE